MIRNIHWSKPKEEEEEKSQQCYYRCWCCYCYSMSTSTYSVDGVYREHNKRRKKLVQINEWILSFLMFCTWKMYCVMWYDVRTVLEPVREKYSFDSINRHFLLLYIVDSGICYSEKCKICAPLNGNGKVKIFVMVRASHRMAHEILCKVEEEALAWKTFHEKKMKRRKIRWWKKRTKARSLPHNITIYYIESPQNNMYTI